MSMMESGFCGMIVIMYNWWVWMCFALFFRMPTLMDFIDFHSMFSFLSFLISVGMYSKMVDVVKTCQSTPAFMGNITVAMIQLYTQSMVVVFLTMWWSHPLEFHWYLGGSDFQVLKRDPPKVFWNWDSVESGFSSHLRMPWKINSEGTRCPIPIWSGGALKDSTKNATSTDTSAETTMSAVW